MMNNIVSLFTFDYDRETQLVPAVALFLAPIISINLLGVKVGSAIGTTIGGISLGAIVSILTTRLIRDQGKSFARRYFKGYPTTVTSLRLRENAGYLVDQRRAKLEALTGVNLLTKRQEIAKPGDADQRLQHVTDSVRDMMRDQKKFPILWRELKSYGYWRNMLAIKPWGIALSILSVLAPMAVMLILPHGHRSLQCVAILAGVAGLSFWTIGVRRKRFIAASDRYADEFFRGIFQL